MTDETQGAPAPQEDTPAPAAEAATTAIVLTEYTEIDGELRPKGKVMKLPEAQAQELIASNKARIATEFDRRVGGVD